VFVFDTVIITGANVFSFRFNVIVEANDGGTPPGKSNTTVRIQVMVSCMFR
jgi:hypothetical protein